MIQKEMDIAKALDFLKAAEWDGVSRILVKLPFGVTLAIPAGMTAEDIEEEFDHALEAVRLSLAAEDDEA